MKKIILIACILLAFNSFSQTSTKKYNTLQERYEYFDQNGRMVGYEKYNSLSEQWEYYSTKKKQRSNNYSEPVSTFDPDLAIKVLQIRQNQYNNKKKVYEKNKFRIDQQNEDIYKNAYSIKNLKLQKEVIRLYNLRINKFLKNNNRNVLDNYTKTTDFINNKINIYNNCLQDAKHNIKSIATVKATNSYLKWNASNLLNTNRGTIALSSGYLTILNDDIIGGEFIVDMSSLTSTNLSGKSKSNLEGHLKSKDFFNVNLYPTSRLSIISTKKNRNGYLIEANLVIKDLSNEISFQLEIDDKKAEATISIDRTKYNVKYGSNTFFENLGDLAIDDIFNLYISFNL
jgi:polyisoprenoid-binding protein YceI